VNEISEADFAASFRPPPAGSAGEVLTRRLATPDLDDLAETLAAKAAADARAEQREQLIAANRASGDPIGQVSRYQGMVSELRGEVLDLETQLEAARGRLNRAAENLVHWSEQADEIRTAVAGRSDSVEGDLLAPAKAVLAGHQQYVAASRAAIAAVQAGTPRQRRPFGGEVRRSEFTCAGCKAEGIDPDTSFLIHNGPDRHPGLDAEIDFYPDPDHAERRRVRSGYAREISR
jgi:hypothetical protein